jgi:hypothetical protein
MADEAAPQVTVTMIDATYTVQNPHITPSAARAIIQGKEMIATVDAFEVELVADSLSHGGIKLRFIGDEIPEAQSLFVNDSKVTATFKAATAK